MSDRPDCRCPMRDGAHEWPCGHVGEYEFVHCKHCDQAVWMCEVAMSRCRECQKLFPVWGQVVWGPADV